MNQFQDKEIQCVDCPDQFIFTARDQEFYGKKGFPPPKRCSKCRIKKKNKFGDGGQRRDRDGESTYGNGY